MKVNKVFIPWQYRSWQVTFLLRMNVTVFKKFFAYPVAIAIIILQRLLSPILLIRITYMNVDRIGILYKYYWQDCQGEKNKSALWVIDLFMASEEISNVFWLELFKRKFCIFSYNHILARVLHINQRISASQNFYFPSLSLMDLILNKPLLDNIIHKKDPYFKLDDVEIKKGRAILSQMGIPENASFICFHNRDTAYLDVTTPDKSSTYHNYRDSTIDNYLKAASYLNELGHYSIRVGAFVKEKVENAGEKIIDYSSGPFRDDFMDVFLGSQCKLFITSDVGIATIPELFDVPAVYANIVPLARVSVWIKTGLFIPKRFFSKKLNRDLKFKEILSDSELTLHPETDFFLKKEIELIENTSDEILLATKEMVARLEGTWEDTEEMKTLQKKYWSLAPYINNKSENYNISSTYLVMNKHLFE